MNVNVNVNGNLLDCSYLVHDGLVEITFNTHNSSPIGCGRPKDRCHCSDQNGFTFIIGDGGFSEQDAHNKLIEFVLSKRV